MARRDHYSIKLPGPRFGAVRQLECFAEEVRHRRRLPVLVDMRGVKFIKPLAVVAIVMFLQGMIARGRQPWVAFPSHPGVLNYLLAIGLPEMMDQLGQWNWPSDFPREAPEGLRPMVRLTKFSTTDDVERIAEEMANVFVMEGLGSLLKPSHVVFSELAENVVAHSGSPGFILAQRYEYAEGPVIDIAVGDSGMGVRQALSGNPKLRPKLTDDRQALVLAMTDGVTGVAADRYRGYGLGHVSAELVASGRWLVVRSGRATGYWREGRRISVSACGESFGTLVHAVIPC